MARHCPSWIDAYVALAAHTEAPKLMHFWAAVWAISGVLRKKVWMDQIAFRWIPNFFIIFVAPPGIVSKSTTAGMAESFLREIPGIRFGPDVVTWQSLVTSFAASCESFEFEGEYYPMSPLNLIASELGNLIDPHNKEMVNLFIDLWDGRKKLEKQTKTSGNDVVEGPWINLLGCTTPHWIAENMPASTVGGGLTSRCIFVYAEAKEHFVAYPKYNFPKDTTETRKKLIQDLEHIATSLCGEYILSPEARTWGEAWYLKHWKTSSTDYPDERFEGYVARKQTHLHKLAMILAASQRDALIITVDDLILAEIMLKATEADFAQVFSRIGKSETSMQADRLIAYIKRAGEAPYEQCYRNLHTAFPDARDFEGIVSGAIKAGYLELVQRNGKMILAYVGKD
jgi:hypothetical protein